MSGTLHVFGCSMASGYTFSGNDKPDKSFGRYCADELAMDYQIHATNASSNLYAYHCLVDHIDNITPNDIVVIMWTYPNRTVIYDGGHPEHIMSSKFYESDGELSRKYYNDIYNDDNCMLETTSVMLASNMLCNTRNIPIINSTHWFTQCRGQGWYFNHKLLKQSGIQFPECMLYKFISNNTDESPYDGFHPSENATKEYGLRLANYIRDKYEQD